MDEPTVVWWLSQEATEQIWCAFDGRPEGMPFPLYIRREIISRFGRPGLGRLWIAPDLPDDDINPWPEDMPLSKAAADCGGIVIWERDAPQVCGWPGFVTFRDLRPWSPAGKH